MTRQIISGLVFSNLLSHPPIRRVYELARVRSAQDGEGRQAMRIGDVSRRRRFADPARMRWYAHYRCVRFSRRMLCGTPPASSKVGYS
jgi:hypothetical protein